MEFTDILVAQLGDPFRIGLLVTLLFTARNTSSALNRWVPIALGLVFVAVLIPTAMASEDSAPVAEQIGFGLLSNAAILGVLIAGQLAFERFRK